MSKWDGLLDWVLMKKAAEAPTEPPKEEEKKEEAKEETPAPVTYTQEQVDAMLKEAVEKITLTPPVVSSAAPPANTTVSKGVSKFEALEGKSTEELNKLWHEGTVAKLMNEV